MPRVRSSKSGLIANAPTAVATPPTNPRRDTGCFTFIGHLSCKEWDQTSVQYAVRRARWQRRGKKNDPSVRRDPVFAEGGRGDQLFRSYRVVRERIRNGR